MGIVQDTIVNILLDTSSSSLGNNQMTDASQMNLAKTQDSLAPFSLGTFNNKDNIKRLRKEIYTKYQRMATFAPIAEALSIHVTAALGGDAITGQLVYITPSKEVRDNKDTTLGKVVYDKLMSRIKPLEKIINENIIKLVTDAVAYGDAYGRVYADHDRGVYALTCNELTYPPLIQAYEQGGVKTVAFQALDTRTWQQTVSKFNVLQMIRIKMPRIQNVNQFDITDGLYSGKILQEDNLSNAPILPAMVGGSFLTQIERPFDDVMIALSCMNSQQVADAVNQMFLAIDMSAMPPAQRAQYQKGLTDMIGQHEQYIKGALQGGEGLWNTKFHVLPTSGEKQVVNPLGDIKGQRTGGVDIEKFMINVRLLMGGIGLDPSMVGWADMLSGGLGDGAAFHTSAQIMRRSSLIRQATKQVLDDLIAIDWGYKFNEVFDENELPWNVEFYSDQSAAATEQTANQRNRMDSTILKTQVIAQLKDLGLSESVMSRILERDCGMDYDEATEIAKSIVESREKADVQQGGF